MRKGQEKSNSVQLQKGGSVIVHPSADKLTSRKSLMSDLSVDGCAENFYHVRSWLWTICPCLDQSPINCADELFMAMTLSCQELDQHHKYFISSFPMY